MILLYYLIDVYDTSILFYAFLSHVCNEYLL